MMFEFRSVEVVRTVLGDSFNRIRKEEKLEK